MTGGSGSTIARAPPVRDNGRMSEASDEELLQQAWAVLENAHSPYSKMRVGAALRARDGRVFAGCNVENASFGLTICAERTAIGNAVAAGVKEFDSVAIVSDAGALLMFPLQHRQSPDRVTAELAAEAPAEQRVDDPSGTAGKSRRQRVRSTR